MSKPVKGMMIEDYRQRFEGVEGALVLDVRGINANDNNALRNDLREKDIRITVVKNTLARTAFEGKPLEALAPALIGPAALAYGAESVVDVARAVISWAKKIQNLELRGAVLEGQFYEGEEGVKKLSEMPTREEALASAVQLILTPGGNIVSAATSPGGNILGIVKEIQDRLEEGETISKAG